MISILNIIRKTGATAYVAPYRYDCNSSHSEISDMEAYYPGESLNLHGVFAEPDLMKYNIPASCSVPYPSSYMSPVNKEDWGLIQQFGRISYKTCYYLGTPLGFSDTVSDAHKNYIYSKIGFYPSTLTYGWGNDSGKNVLIGKFLGGRNSLEFYGSTPTDAETTFGNYNTKYYGYPNKQLTIYNLISKNNSSRWLDIINPAWYNQTIEVADAYLTSEINKTIINKGWFNNFIHWQNANVGQLGHYFNLINNIYSNVWKCSYDEIVEYYWYRQLISSLTITNTTNSVIVTINKMTIPDYVDPLLLQTPISIVVDLSKSQLRNKSVVSSNCVGIKNLGSNKYVFDIPFEYDNFIITPGNANYSNFNLPNIVYQNYSNGVFNIKTDIPTRLAIYIVSRGGNYDQCVPLYRDCNLSTNHKMDFNNSLIRNYYTIKSLNTIEISDLYVGIISSEKQSILSNVIQLA
jgi:hypothetical protein